MLSPSCRRAIRQVLDSSPVVAEIQADLDARPGRNLGISVADALYGIIAAAGVGHGFAARLDRAGRMLRHANLEDPGTFDIPTDYRLGAPHDQRSPQEIKESTRRFYRTYRRTLEAIGEWGNGKTDGVSNVDRLAYTLLLASVPRHARSYNCVTIDSAGVQAANRSNNTKKGKATKVSARMRRAAARVRSSASASERAKMKKLLFGFGLHVEGRFDPEGKDDTLWVAMVRLTPGNRSEPRTFAEMLRAQAALGQPILNLVVADRGYTHVPSLRDLIESMHGDLVADLRDFQSRAYLRPDGIWIFGGGAYDPATPPGLFDRKPRGLTEDLTTWLKKYDDDLGEHRLAHKNPPDVHGVHRLTGNCRRYGADCPLQPLLSRPGGTVYVKAPPGNENFPLCNAHTQQIDRDAYRIPKSGNKNGTIPTYQPLPYGTYEHAAVYAPWRSRTEGMLGTLTEHHGMWGGRHGFKVRNFEILQLFAIAAGVAYNLTRQGHFPTDHGTDDCNNETTLVLPDKHRHALDRILTSRHSARTKFDPGTCPHHDHPPYRELLTDPANDPPAT